MSKNRLSDFLVTIICWAWFTAGFLFCFSWRYAAAALFARDTETCFQRLNSRFYQIFFRILRTVAPSHRWEIDGRVAAIRSAVVICNHLSYLDPLLLIAQWERHRTMVKTRFFTMPIFGWVIKKAGYLPASGQGEFAAMMIEQLESMKGFLDSGGNLFIFPEGTRSRDGKVGRLNRGALKIARLCQAPIYVLRLADTDKLFTPGKFLFNTGITNTISLKIIDRIAPDRDQMPSTVMLEQKVLKVYCEQQS